MNKISEHITYNEATHSETAKRRGIDNTPTAEQLRRMVAVANAIFEPTRNHFGSPIGVNSFFRSEALNTAVGGAKQSQHVLGEAIDMDADKYGTPTNKAIFDFIRANLPFDKLIWEFGDDENPDWVHVSHRLAGNRREVYRASRVNGKTVYTRI